MWREHRLPGSNANPGPVYRRSSHSRKPRGHAVLHRGRPRGSDTAPAAAANAVHVQRGTPQRVSAGSQASAPLLNAPVAAVHGPPAPIPEDPHPWCRRVYLHILGISTLDVIANVIEIVSADGLGSHAGAVSMVLAQGVLPISVVLSLLVLGTR